MEAQPKRDRPFVPAMHADWLTPFYDRWVRLLIPEEALKQQLIDQAGIRPGMRVLDLGCGTGTLVLLLKRSQPEAKIIGLDVDPKILCIAQRKITAAGMDIELRRDRIEDADFAPASFDRILSSFVLHHLTTDEKRSALGTARQLLRAGGELHITDLGPPVNRYVRSVLSRVGPVLGGDRVAANISGRLPALMREAGFSEVAETDRVKTAFGRVAFYRATT